LRAPSTSVSQSFGGLCNRGKKKRIISQISLHQNAQRSIASPPISAKTPFLSVTSGITAAPLAACHATRAAVSASGWADQHAAIIERKQYFWSLRGGPQKNRMTGAIGFCDCRYSHSALIDNLSITYSAKWCAGRFLPSKMAGQDFGPGRGSALGRVFSTGRKSARNREWLRYRLAQTPVRAGSHQPPSAGALVP